MFGFYSNQCFSQYLLQTASLPLRNCNIRASAMTIVICIQKIMFNKMIISTFSTSITSVGQKVVWMKLVTWTTWLLISKNRCWYFLSFRIRLTKVCYWHIITKGNLMLLAAVVMGFIVTIVCTLKTCHSKTVPKVRSNRRIKSTFHEICWLTTITHPPRTLHRYRVNLHDELKSIHCSDKNTFNLH